MKSLGVGVCLGNQIKPASIVFSYLLLVLMTSFPARAELVAAWGGNTYGQTQIPEGLNDVVAISGGLGHNLALQADGTVVCWGNYPSSSLNTPPANLPFVTAIAAGANHSLALTAEGTVIAWGDNTYGQTNVPSDISNVVAIAAGYEESVALEIDGTVHVWGQFPGINPAPAVTDVVAIASGANHIVALTTGGMVIAWGDNTYGQTNVPTGLSDVIAIGAGATCSFAITQGGGVVGWGDNSYGQLDIPTNLSNVTEVCGGVSQGLALEADGAVVAWGAGGSSTNFGQGTVPPELSNVKAIAAGYYCNLALTFAGPVQITEDPQSQTVPTGTNVYFSVAATGAQPMGYQWFMNGEPLVDGSGVAGSATDSLFITNAQSGEAGNYTVLVSNSLGSVLSAPASLNFVGLPQITVQPTNQSALFFGSAMFSVQAQSGFPLTYQWVLNGEPLVNQTNADLILGPLLCEQSGYYNCIVSNESGAISSAKAQLTVYQTVFADNSAYQTFFLQFSNVTQVLLGSGAVFGLLSDGTVVGNSENPELKVPANLFDVAAISCGSFNLALQSNGNIVEWGFQSITVPTLSLTNVISVASGYPYCAAVQSNGSVVAWSGIEQSETVTATFANSNTLGPPNIIAAVPTDYGFYLLRADGTVYNWPVTGPAYQEGVSNIIAFPSGAGIYSLSPDGLTVNGTLLEWGGNFPENPALNISNAVAFGASSGSVVALNPNGTVTDATFPLTVSNAFGVGSLPLAVAMIGDGAPVITVQPGNQTWTNGSTIYLHVRAVGVQPMVYQWQLDGTNLPGATNADLIITNSQEVDTGQYSAMASNKMGVATSRLAAVTIVPALPPPPPPDPYTLAQALGATNLVWTTSASYGSSIWFSEVTNTHNGIAAAQSGATSNNASTTLETVITGPGILTFWWQVSSEEFFDYLSFEIGGSEMARISGEVGWEQVAFPIPIGNHLVEWIYAKDPTVSAGEDAGWLSEVNFVPAAIKLGAPAISPNGTVQFNAYASNGTSVALNGLLNLTFEVSSNLVDWEPFTNAVTFTNGSAQLTDAGATNSAMRFYRLVNQ